MIRIVDIFDEPHYVRLDDVREVSRHRDHKKQMNYPYGWRVHAVSHYRHVTIHVTPAEARSVLGKFLSTASTELHEEDFA